MPNSLLRNTLANLLAMAIASAIGTVLSGNLLVGLSVGLVVVAVGWLFVVPTRRALNLEPIQESGANVYLVDREGDPSKKPPVDQQFTVALEFDFGGEHELTVNNLDLWYLPTNDDVTPRRQTLTVDDEEYEFDGNQQLKGRVSIPENEVRTFELAREFRIPQSSKPQYGQAVLVMDVLSEAWNGVREVTASGELAPGGKWNVSEVELEGGPISRLDTLVRKVRTV